MSAAGDPPPEPVSFVSRAGTKLAHALDEFKLEVAGLTCADFGCNVGGFTDCLLRRGAARVFALDTAYGTLDWRLRNDPRVVVMERTNALHAPAPSEAADLIVIDLGWTPQSLAIPASLRWLSAANQQARIITLVKPHYEASAANRRNVQKGGLSAAEAEATFHRVRDEMPSVGVRVVGECISPLTGAKSARSGEGNREYLLLLART